MLRPVILVCAILLTTSPTLAQEDNHAVTARPMRDLKHVKLRAFQPVMLKSCGAAEAGDWHCRQNYKVNLVHRIC